MASLCLGAAVVTTTHLLIGGVMNADRMRTIYYVNLSDTTAAESYSPTTLITKEMSKWDLAKELSFGGLRNRTALVRAFEGQAPREGVAIVLGVPTVRRESNVYLYQMLASILNNMDEEEKSEALIIVYVAEPDDVSYAMSVAAKIKAEHPAAVESSFVEVNHCFCPNRQVIC